MQIVTDRCSARLNPTSLGIKKTNSVVYSSALCGMALFILVNIVGSFIDSSNKQKQGAYISCGLLTSPFLEVKPSIVLLGSSLIRMPFWLADRLHTDFVPDYSHYCQNFTLQNILRKAGFKNDEVSDFAIDGEMVSDAFLIEKKLLEKECYPEWIIYGIAPRDFVDNLLSKETRTPIFDSLFTLADIWLKQNGFVISLNERLNLTLEKLLFFFDKRKQIQNSLATLYYNFLCKTLSIKRRQIDDYNQSKEISQLLEYGQDTNLWNSSIREYKKRYQTFDDKQLKKQQLFLKNLCQNAINNDCKMLLVNMPLTKENIALMPPGAYEKYRKAIQIAKQFKGVYLLDLQAREDFGKNLYRDSAHLNEKGAHLLSMIISDTLRIIRTTGASQFNSSSKTSYQETTPDGVASWWLTKAYFANSSPPDVVLLGSSQLGPLFGADANVYKKLIDITGERRSRILEHDFYGLLGKTWKVFIGALPNAMISDQFIISRALFSNQYKPKLAILTFSPRDFIDSYYSDPTKTEAYAFFSKYIGAKGSTGLRNAVKRNCGTYDDPQNPDGKYLAGVSPLILGKPFERLCPGEITINSIDGCIVRDNSEEYKCRYKYPLSPQLNMQLHYFDSLLKYLAQQHIRVIGFNLPLREDNKKLLPNSFWKYYDDRISEICKKNGADYISVERFVLPFKDNEFIDGVHLNPAGGLRVSKVIAVYGANKFRWKTFQELLAICDKCLL